MEGIEHRGGEGKRIKRSKPRTSGISHAYTRSRVPATLFNEIKKNVAGVKLKFSVTSNIAPVMLHVQAGGVPDPPVLRQSMLVRGDDG